MKLIIQIPCYNEEQNLPATIKDLPSHIEGIDEIEVLIIDDGSVDNTVGVARQIGVRNIVQYTSHKGLARAFSVGLDACVKLGADIVVNTDADNQYNGNDIARLVNPILARQADIVIGTRDIRNMKHFSWMKKILQRIGSSFVRSISRTTVPD